jgi:16S rRNA processing protein RimM
LDDLILVGKVTSVFGIKGWVTVHSYTDPAENILTFKNWLLFPSSLTSSKANKVDKPEFVLQCKKIKVAEGQRHGKKVIARLQSSQSREEAGKYLQHDIYVLRAELPELDDDEVYWIDLEGLQVINLQDKVLGRVARLIETGANDVLVVVPENVVVSEKKEQQRSKSTHKTDQKKLKEILIPYVEDHYIQDIDIEAGWIKVDWPFDDEAE